MRKHAHITFRMSSASVCIVYLTLVGIVSLAQPEKAAVQPLGWNQGFVFQFSVIKKIGNFFQNTRKISQILN